MNLLLRRIPPLNHCPNITESEVSDVLATCKAGKSCGDDGISYELLNVLMHSGLKVHLVDLFNAILFQIHEIPPSWLLSHLTFLPKIDVPSLPKHLRPIVLSSTPCKLFTKILLMRLRSSFPPIAATQLACIPGSQTLDGSTCLQHIIHLSQEYRLPLIAIKLDVSSAFDHLSHDAVASFLALCGGRLEALMLLRIITLSRVSLNMSGVSWQQKLFRGLLQGSSYSAEIFGRTLDHFLGFLNTRWSISENTWIQSTDPHGHTTKLFNLLYADDIILLATSFEQAHRLLEGVIDILSSIGLTLALDKCKFIISPDLRSRSLDVRGISISPVRAFRFLGVLMGFDIDSQTILAARLSMTNNAFWGYYKILRRPGSSLRKRLHLLNTFVTSKWRWISPCIRPVTAVRNMLSVMHNTLLTSLCGLTPDPFVTSSSNWFCRRRASKMCAQALSHQSWAGIHALTFMSYWGHAARICTHRLAPISIVLRIRDTFWLHRHWKSHRRALGYWPNSYRLIQLAWEELRGLGTPPFCEHAALNKDLWKRFVNSWLTFKSLQPLTYYPDLTRVDLQGRSLLQVGEKFTLLPFRHVPIEPDYESSFQFVPAVAVEDTDAVLQVCSDGSSRDRKGALAVSFLAPYTPIEHSVVSQAAIQGTCTSIRAEIRAAIQALRMIRAALPYLGEIAILFMTDSTFVLQVLQEHCLFNCHPNDLHELLHLWKQVCNRVSAKHVKGHSGHPLNTLTDHAARAALLLTHNRIIYRTADYKKVFMTSPCQNMPRFQDWL